MGGEEGWAVLAYRGGGEGEAKGKGKEDVLDFLTIEGEGVKGRRRRQERKQGD